MLGRNSWRCPKYSKEMDEKSTKESACNGQKDRMRKKEKWDERNVVSRSRNQEKARLFCLLFIHQEKRCVSSKHILPVSIFFHFSALPFSYFSLSLFLYIYLFLCFFIYLFIYLVHWITSQLVPPISFIMFLFLIFFRRRNVKACLISCTFIAFFTSSYCTLNLSRFLSFVLSLPTVFNI